MYYPSIPNSCAQCWAEENGNFTGGTFPEHAAANFSLVAPVSAFGAPPTLPPPPPPPPATSHCDTSFFCVPAGHHAVWAHYAWAGAMRGYYDFWYHWQMYQQLRMEAAGDYFFADHVLPPKVMEFSDTSLQGATAENTDVFAANNNFGRKAGLSGEASSSHITEVQKSLVPFQACGNKPEMDTMEHDGFSENAFYSSCLLCGERDHRYTACALFDGRTVCFVHTEDSTIYAMSHDRWIEGSTLRDVFLFLHLAAGLEPDKINLRFGGKILKVEDYPCTTRCCDLQLLPGVVVLVFERHDISLTRRSLQLSNNFLRASSEQSREGGLDDKKENVGSEAFDAVSATASVQKQQGLFPLPERHVNLKVRSMGDYVYESVSDGCERERSWLSVGEATAAPSSELPDRVNDDFCDTHFVEANDAEVGMSSQPQNFVTGGSHISNLSAGDASWGQDKQGDAGEHHVHAGDEYIKEQPTDAVHVGMALAVQKDMGSEGRKAPFANPLTSMEFQSSTIIDSEESRRRRTVHVKFIPLSMSFMAIRNLLWSCGEVYKVRLVRPKVTTNPERMFYVCFVEYATVEGAEAMMKLQGHRLAESFRLAVEFCRHPIRGGYITDRDASTGKPCTFGLGDDERRAVELNFRSVGGDDGNSTKGKSDDNDHSINNNDNYKQTQDSNNGGNNDHTDSVVGSCAKEVNQWRGCEGNRVKLSHRRQTAHVVKYDNERNLSSQTKNGEVGPYTLQIVVTADRRKRTRRGGCRTFDASGMGGEKESVPGKVLQPVSVKTTDSLTVFSKVARHKMLVGNEKDLNDSLRSAAARYLQNTTQKNFFDVLTVLEEVRWNTVTAVFCINLLQFEVALFLHHGQQGCVESATNAAMKAVNFGNGFVQFFSSFNGRSPPAMWRSLFTSTPLARQKYELQGEECCDVVDGKEEEEEEGVAGPDGDDAKQFYPSCAKVAHFVEHLIDIALLFDDFQLKNCQQRGEAGVAVAATWQSCDDNSEMSGVFGVVCGLLKCARSLLRCLLRHLRVGPGPAAAAEEVTRVLQLFPAGADMRVGCLMAAFLPDSRQLTDATLLSRMECGMLLLR